MAPFRYESIDLEGPAFRLVRLLKGNCVENIQCELFQAYLPPVGGGIPYEALSYTWGGTAKPDTIEINGSVMDVTINLYLALQHLRFEDKDRILWIDAICIDQGNMEERGHQVRQMADIYKEAEQVLIWLGSATDEINLIMNSLKRLQEESFNHPCHDWKHSDVRWMEMWSVTQLASDCAYQHVKGRQQEGLELLLGRPWFKRIWILQEVANARGAVVVCGTKSVLARIFALAPSLVGVNSKPHCQAVLDIFPGSSRNNSWWSQKRDLHTLLVKFGKSEATDPRDIIYALLGMSSDARDTDLLRANYSKPVQEVIRETTSFLLSLNRVGYSIHNLPHWTLPEFLYNLNSLSSTVLKWTMSTEQQAAVKLLVERSDIDVNLKDNGQTALSWAAERGHEAVVKLLIERNDIDVNLKVMYGRTALSRAAAGGHVAVVKLLAEHGDINVNLEDDNRQTALSWATAGGHKAVVKLLVGRGDIDVNLKGDNSQAALSWAAWEGHEAIVKLLIERNDIDVNLKNAYGQTALSQAVWGGNEAVVKLLIERSDVDVNLKDKHGRTALSRAAWGGYEAIVKLLIERNDIDVNLKDMYGQTALSRAAAGGHEAVVKLLKSKRTP
ncbi:ankyrin repeat-containing domain protein [Halenospora varia]|nr:ankyrin repeat-containing domain protein [Halenospora varia]